MAITKLTTDLNIVSALADLPNATSGLTAAQVKAKFDEGPNGIKAYINDVLTVELESTTEGSSGADKIGATAISGLSGTNVQSLLRSINGKVTALNPIGGFYVVTDPTYGAVGDGVTDDTAAIQSAIDAAHNSGGGIVYIPRGIFFVSSTLVLKPNVILTGSGAGAYFAGTGYDRISVIKPSSGFVGNDIIRADPADISYGLSYTFGIAIRNLLIDMLNVKNSAKTAIKLMSLSNTENFENLRIINNNNGTDLYIGISANETALVPDGLVFSNVYTLPADVGSVSTNPVLRIESGNEISFRDCKFQGPNHETVGSMAALISSSPNTAINAITFDSCSFTGSEIGVNILGKDTDGTGSRWVRIQNCTFEGVKDGIVLYGTLSRPVQFCTVGPGNRFISMSGKAVRLLQYANNNQIFADEFAFLKFEAGAKYNLIFGSPSGNIEDGGTSNRVFARTGEWEPLTLTSGWVSSTPSRVTAAYRKDSSGRVWFRGYLTGGTYGYPNFIFTLPVGFRPTNGTEFSVACGSATGACRITILADGTAFANGGSGELSLDNISFFTD